ncbi:MAG: HlyD family efflux transporter periplasmic adaptor subunit, partial [Planctomycetota bacterium]
SLSALGAKLELSVDGEVVPYREAVIATEVAGKVIFKSDDCEAGTFVQKGAVLMRIDPTDYELEVERLTRAKEQTYQSIRESDQERVNTQRLIKMAKDDIAIQERELKRQKSLPKGFSSQGDVDRAQRAVLQASQQLLAYENTLDLLERKRASLMAAEQLAETQLRVANVNQERCVITAPIDGVIVREDAELNTFVNRGSPIVTMEDTSKVEVASSLRMDQIYWIASQTGGVDSDLPDPGSSYKLPETPARIEFELAGRNGLTYRWDGRLVGFDGIGMDASTRTAPVRILVDNPREYLDQDGRPHETKGPTALVRGMFVKVVLEITPRVPLLAIPEKAIKAGNRIWHFIPDDSVLEADATDGAGPAQSDSAQSDPADGATELTAAENEADAEAKDPEATVDDSLAVDDQADSFDHEAWLAGRVKVVNQIVPIDELSARVSSELTQASPDGSLLKNERGDSIWWICELPSGSLKDGAFVVLSPLGSIPDGGLAARAPKLEPPIDRRDESTDVETDRSASTKPIAKPGTTDSVEMSKVGS